VARELIRHVLRLFCAHATLPRQRCQAGRSARFGARPAVLLVPEFGTDAEAAGGLFCSTVCA
jgi:hypothetical protein